MHGGFEKETPNFPTNSIMKINILDLFRNMPSLKTKLETFIGAAKKRNGGAGSGQVAATDGTDGGPNGS